MRPSGISLVAQSRPYPFWRGSCGRSAAPTTLWFAEIILLSACLARHGLPRTPADLGLSPAEFTKAVLHAPATRPGRYTILERLDLDERAIAERVEEFAAAIGSER